MTTGSKSKRGLSREEVSELYGDLRKAMSKVKSGEMPKSKGSSDTSSAAKQIAAEIKKAMARDVSGNSGARSSYSESRDSSSISSGVSADMITSAEKRGQLTAVMFVLFFGFARAAFTIMEGFGVAGVQSAEASIPMKQQAVTSGYSREEVRVLSTLDSRRAELAERARSIDERQAQLDARDREFAVRVAQLKELTDKLKLDRDKTEKKKNSQLEQLANVYGAMSPQEAAQLMEQLDVQIAMSLIEKMPEKRIGQILALMGKERALTITKMLSGRAG